MEKEIVELVNEQLKIIEELRRIYEKLMNKEPLTQEEQAFLDRLEKGVLHNTKL